MIGITLVYIIDFTLIKKRGRTSQKRMGGWEEGREGERRGRGEVACKKYVREGKN